MTKSFFLTVSFCLLFFSCKDNVNSASSKLETINSNLLENTDSTTTELEHVLGENQNILINSDYYLHFIQQRDKSIADKSLYKLNDFTRLKNGEDQFTYYIADSIHISNAYKTFLIIEDYDSESAVWLVNYTTNNDLIDALEVYYDNAEGAWTTISIIDPKAHSITLTRYDAYADPEKTIRRAKISSDGKFEK